MKVALVHDWLSGLGGSENVLFALSEIFPDAPIFTSVYNKKALPQFNRKKIYTSFLERFPFAQKRPQYYLPLMPAAFASFDLSEFDLVISNCHCACKGVITKPETLHICYLHTPIRYIWFPYIDPRLSGSFLKNIIAHKMRLWDFQAAFRVDRFVANSKNVALRIKKIYRQEAKVIYPPVKTSFFKPVSQNKISDYFLFVSRLISYKKADLVIETFNQLGFPLKIIGIGPDYLKLKKMAKRNIEFLGKLSADELRKYYSQAKAFIFPGYEDFGIVAVEAMSSGRPVIAYKKGGMAEIIKEGVSGIFFEEQSVESLKKAILDFKPESFDPQKIRKEAEKFDEGIFKKNFLEYTKEEFKKWRG